LQALWDTGRGARLPTSKPKTVDSDIRVHLGVSVAGVQATEAVKIREWGYYAKVLRYYLIFYTRIKEVKVRESKNIGQKWPQLRNATRHNGSETAERGRTERGPRRRRPQAHN